MPGVSKFMKQRYGKFLVEGVNQVDQFLHRSSRDEIPLDSFQLDVDAIFGPPVIRINQIPPTQSQAIPETQHYAEWSDSDGELFGKLHFAALCNSYILILYISCIVVEWEQQQTERVGSKTANAGPAWNHVVR